MYGKKIIIGTIIGATIVLTLVTAVILKNSQAESNIENSSNKIEVAIVKPDKVEVFLFHPTQRCITCITIGKFAGKTVAEFFQPELKGGLIEFREINIDLPENKILAQKFQASGSSLRINVITNGQDNISEDTYVWRLTQDETQFKSYLKNKLDNLLGK
ncbi:MAG: nitrophenyl compound nitroreductase subunit ArsF family protein [Atribacterota bacterium]|nr:nitrophenyl compound nitroreductase subunit ArsF family protein [Atribacterota bacterium]